MAFRFEKLDVWNEAICYALKIYTITKSFPREELFALVNQLKRAVTSVSTNIAEGSGSSSKKDFCHYLDISIKSLYEVVSLILLAEKLQYISEETRKELYEEADHLVRKIRALQNSIEKNS